MTARIIIGILGILVILLSALLIADWWNDRKEVTNATPPGFIDIEKGTPPQERSTGRRLTHRVNPVLQEGTQQTDVAKEKAERFAESVRDSMKPAELPEVKGRYSDGVLDLAVGDSKGFLHRSRTECPEPCEFGTRANEMFSESPRTLFRWNWQKDVRDCVIWTGAGAGVGATKDAPLEGAIGGMAICGTYKILKARL